MSSAFEDYDAFLASFNNNNSNVNGYKDGTVNAQSQQQQSQLASGITHDPSMTNSITSNEEEAILDPYYDFNADANANSGNINGNFYLSPDSIIGTSNSSSPNDFNLSNELLDGAPDYNYEEATMTGQPQLKQESVSPESSSVSPVPQLHNRVKLSDAVPHSTITKRVGKKEKSSHNMIEKRYRTNINDKINALRDAVPALRVLVDSGDDEFDDNELEGLQPAKKLNKATILSKATEYIKHLEKKNEGLKKENDALKNHLYGVTNGNITPESSVSSYSSETRNNSRGNNSNNNNTNNNGGSYPNKFLLGGLACMVGAGLNDDFNNVDSTRSLFALPVFSFNQQGSHVLSKPLVILFKIALILCVLLNFVFPNIFQSKKKNGVEMSSSVAEAEDIEDVRYLSKVSIWKTFAGKDSSNNEYVKKSVIRALKLKIDAESQNYIYARLINLYVEHLWNYLKQVQLDSNEPNYDYLKLILSLENSESIHNAEYLKRLLSFEAKSNLEDNVLDEEKSPRDYSIIRFLYQMVNETKTNAILAKFMNSTINSSFEPIETKVMCEHINVELTALFNPTDENISNLKETLSKVNINEVKDDEIFIMYASIIQNLIFIKKDFANAQRWFKKLYLKLINKFDLLGFTSLYIIILSMTKFQELYQDDQEIILQIEEISGILRIYLGNTSGTSLKFDKRSQLIEFFINVNLKINGLESLNGSNLKSIGVN